MKELDHENQGIFLVTLFAQKKMGQVFGRVKDGRVHATKAGDVVLDELYRLPRIWPFLFIDGTALKPDELKGILVVTPGKPESGINKSPGRSGNVMNIFLTDIIRLYKDITARRMACLNGFGCRQLWEPDHFEHAIESELELANIRRSMTESPPPVADGWLGWRNILPVQRRAV